MTRVVVAALFVAACGGDSGGGGGTDAQLADASVGIKVMEVTCPTSPMTADALVAVNSGGTSYVLKDTTVSVMSVVKFLMTPGHDVKPNPQTTNDPALVVGDGQTKCFQFLATGTYGFYCMQHNFAGTITVQ